MEVLVDTSVWIDYFRSGENSKKLDYLIDENIVVTNELVLAELLPLLILKKELELISLLRKIKKHDIILSWEKIIEYQVMCLKSGSSGIGIPDLIIAQNAIQNDLSVYTLDKHFRFMSEAGMSLNLYN